MAKVSVHKRVSKSDFRKLAEKIAKQIDQGKIDTMVEEAEAGYRIQTRDGVGSYGRPLWSTVAMVSKHAQDPTIHVIHSHLKMVLSLAEEFAASHARNVQIYEADDNEELDF